MKIRLIHPSIMLSIAIFMACMTASAQTRVSSNDKVCNIYLVVDLSLSGKALKESLIIKDDESTSLPVPDSLKNHITLIDSMGSVQWKSIPKDPESSGSDSVKITKVKKKFWFFGGKKLLVDNKIKNPYGPVIGQVKDEYLPEEERYSIYFSVYKNGRVEKYKIDPKLRMKPPGGLR